MGEKAKKDFVVIFSSILRLRNILSAFDQFAGNEILSERDFQDYTGYYTDVYEEIKPKPGDKESIIHDVVFEMELVKQVEVNIDYILMLVAKYHDSNCQDKEILVSIDKAIKSSLELRSKKELIEKFIERVNADTNVDTDWKDFVDKQKNIDLNLIITEQRLKAAETKKFMKNAFRDAVLRTTGNDIDEILPAVSRFSGGGNRKLIKATVIEKLKEYFDKYYGLITDDMSFDTKYEYNASDMGLMMVAEESKWHKKK